MRLIVFWDLYWGPPILGNYHNIPSMYPYYMSPHNNGPNRTQCDPGSLLTSGWQGRKEMNPYGNPDP